MFTDLDKNNNEEGRRSRPTGTGVCQKDRMNEKRK